MFEANGVRLAKTPLVIETSYALPIYSKEFEEYYLDTTDPDHPKIKNPDLFIRRIQGTVSYFRTAGEELFPVEHPMIVEKIPFSEYAFAQYITVRDKERKMEKSSRQKAAAEGVLVVKEPFIVHLVVCVVISSSQIKLNAFIQWNYEKHSIKK